MLLLSVLMASLDEIRGKKFQTFLKSIQFKQSAAFVHGINNPHFCKEMVDRTWKEYF